jgi:hypothetical protein
MWHSWERGKKVYRVLVGKPEGKRTLGRLKHRWEGGIRVDSPCSGSGEHGDEPLGSGTTELVIYSITYSCIFIPIRFSHNNNKSNFLVSHVSTIQLGKLVHS